MQYLTAFSGQSDLEEQSAFDAFVRGERPKTKLDKPYGVAIYDGKVYVCDTNSTVVVFNFKLKSFAPLEGAIGPGRLLQPMNISIEADGTKYVSDPVRGQIVVFDKDDRYLKAYGKPGKWKPVAAVAFEGLLYVVDESGGAVVVF